MSRWSTVGFSTWKRPSIIPAEIITVAITKFQCLNLRNRGLRIMQRPIQCSTPNKIGLSGINSNVTKVITIPKANIPEPRRTI